MSTLSLAAGNFTRGQRGEDSGLGFWLSSYFGNELFATDTRGNLMRTSNRVHFKYLEGFRTRNGKKFRVFAKVRNWKKHDYPWPDDVDPNTESPLKYLSNFKPLDEKPKPVTLAFEKPLVDLEQKIIEIQRMADDTGLDFTDQINALELKYQQALKDLYTHLTPIQRLNIARHPNRPTVLDHILNITEKWVELHGDRAGFDDPAIVTGIGSIEGRSYMFIGHQKGRNTKENIMRNFAMPTPHGYRKALRMMKYADHHGFPIVTFVDTPGAFADLKSEELGQGEAIAHNLRTMFGLKVPIITIVTGEGGSGGALAISCANKLMMLENSAFYVASPEACAAILWKSSQASPKAAEKLRITAQEHYKLRIADGIIPEPIGGAHADPVWTSQNIKEAILEAMEELTRMDKEALLRHRMLKFRSIGVGGFREGSEVEPERKRNMKPSEVNAPKVADIESDIEDLKKKILEAAGPSDPITSQKIEKLKEDLDQEMTKAFTSMGLLDRIESLNLELARSPDPDQALNYDLKEKGNKIVQEFKKNLARPGDYLGLKQKLQTLSTVSRLIELKERSEKLKGQVNQKIPADVKAKTDLLKKAREKLSNGNQVDENLSEELERAKKELEEVLKSANLEVIGMVKRKNRTTPPELKEKIVHLNRAITEEIEKAVNKREGISGKIEELKVEMAKDSTSEKAKNLESEIKEGIAIALNVTPLKEKVENLRVEMSSFGKEVVEDNVIVDNGRL
ncbi:acetyl-coenzyme A carboxylase carboxyl transferase subunit alpha, chloroplastic-like isoform X1 [Olea europaea subsp. europaea]|uniref:acetyl-CoA carboxytransferase n=1 Tax=Olea europaea subsp. europaea TaxID=158383 RepID=A0A8S0R936_OLEEU|nr:acetyl-coenzyme A carboxylase carboxyl transferase subunit alpha, chloroplastic-like isoform X1 [Olea europaea subsp. europaea]